ncbi:hypothetical protein I7I48_00859 [Histoplasma ohiense]|nr:hypothetical protein I7I48_00859 [Histoplasma ohiense (nom. inval.)]
MLTLMPGGFLTNWPLRAVLHARPPFPSSPGGQPYRIAEVSPFSQASQFLPLDDHGIPWGPCYPSLKNSTSSLLCTP